MGLFSGQALGQEKDDYDQADPLVMREAAGSASANSASAKSTQSKPTRPRKNAKAKAKADADADDKGEKQSKKEKGKKGKKGKKVQEGDTAIDQQKADQDIDMDDTTTAITPNSNSAVNRTINSTANSTANSAVNSAVNSTVNSTVNSATTGAAREDSRTGGGDTDMDTGDRSLTESTGNTTDGTPSGMEFEAEPYNTDFTDFTEPRKLLSFSPLSRRLFERTQVNRPLTILWGIATLNRRHLHNRLHRLVFVGREFIYQVSYSPNFLSIFSKHVVQTAPRLYCSQSGHV